MIDLPNSPEALGLPGYPEWREHQKETVRDICEALETNNVVLLEAPTGAGKTIIGAGTARALGGRALYLAHTIILQQQQLRTLPGAVTVTGRRNHLCRLPIAEELGLSADDADCPCEEFAVPGGCGYYDQWFRAMEAEDVVLNYAYMVRIVKARGIKVAEGYGTLGEHQNIIPNPFTGRSLMVCDEGHNLERALLDADTVEVYQSSFERYGVRVPSSVEFETWPAWATQVIPDLEMHYADAAKAKYEAMDGSSGRIAADAFKEAQRLSSLLQTLTNVKDLTNTAKFTPMYVARAPHGFTIRPLWAWNRARSLLFSHAERSIVMSATLGTPGLTAKLLGLGTWEHLKIPSTFPVANRPVFYWPVSKMKHGMDESEKLKQAVALVHLARKFPNAAGVVHCNSFPLGKYLVAAVRSFDDCEDVAQRLVLHDSKTRERVFRSFEEDPGNTILVTPSATTGVDWDFVGWQMIPKVPFPDLGDEFTRLRYDYVDSTGHAIGKEVYQQEACKTLVQASGRHVRTPTSKGVTIITDGAFWALYKYIAPDAFPDWFRAAVRWYEPKGG